MGEIDSDLTALRERVRALPGPDREVDFHIANLTGFWSPALTDEEFEVAIKAGHHDECGFWVPAWDFRYTASIDAALAFAEWLGRAGSAIFYEALKLLPSQGWLAAGSPFAPQLARAIIVVALDALIAGAEVAT